MFSIIFLVFSVKYKEARTVLARVPFLFATNNKIEDIERLAEEALLARFKIFNFENIHYEPPVNRDRALLANDPYGYMLKKVSYISYISLYLS